VIPARPGPKLLLVEGIDDLLVAAEVFEKATGTPWEPTKGQRLVEIEWCGSDDQVLSRLGVRWKESGRRIVGVVIDADLTGSRWAQVRAHAPAETRDRLPADLPPGGLVLDADRGRRFGVWIMPDNQSVGAMESFLAQLRTSMPTALGEHVRSAMQRAQELMREHANANPGIDPPLRPWLDVHAHKAEIHTWLAWQEPPGARLHEAVRNHSLDPRAPLACSFVDWMKRLYDL
jgi:hypothetical protein